ncbi:MAG: hypothetical protein ABIV63_08905 [Caldimonas sp.]
MLYMILVFLHLLATSMALGAIVATDLRMLSKLAQDKIRIPPPNDFVARLVTFALAMLYLTGAGILWLGTQKNPEFLSNPKLQAKLVLVLLLTINAFVLHRYTFPRLSRGRSVSRWHLADWVVVLLPVSLSNCLWMFCAFLGIARPWNDSMPMRDVLLVAASLWVFAMFGVGLVLAVASRRATTGRAGEAVSFMKRSLAAVGGLGRALEPTPKRKRKPSSNPNPKRRAPEVAEHAVSLSH